jgi:hypothetical protein
MNLLEKMNAAEYKKILEYKEKYPILGQNLVNALSEKLLVSQLTISEYIDLCHALRIHCSPALNQVFESFQSKP